MGLKDLPVHPTLTADKVKDAYIAEVHAVTTVEQLKAFVERWKPLYKLELESPRWPDFVKDGKRWVCSFKTKDSYRKLCEGDIDFEEALSCMKKGQVPKGEDPMKHHDVCEHAPHFSCPGVHICLPMGLMAADFVAAHYGVGTDLALIQANGGLGAFEGAMEPLEAAEYAEEDEWQSTSSKEPTDGSPTSGPPK